MNNKHQKGMCLPQSHTKSINIIEQFRATNKKRGLIYIKIYIFLVYMKVNFAAILEFFFQIYSSVTFISATLCYHKYIILSSTWLVNSNSKYIKNGGCLGFEGQIKVIYFQWHKNKIIN